MTPTPTTVISVRGKSRDSLLADPNFVYVGRKVAWTPWTDSDWGNPFGHGRNGFFVLFTARDWYETRGRALLGMGHQLTPIDLYDAWLDSRHGLLARLPELVGKQLGCWCGEWSPGNPPIPCHAHRLAVRANRLAGVDLSVCEMRATGEAGTVQAVQQREMF